MHRTQLEGGRSQRTLAVDVETECFECDWGMGVGVFSAL